MDSQPIGPIGALLRQEALLRQKRLLHRQQQVVGDIRNRRATDGALGSRRSSVSTQQDDRRQPYKAGIVSNTRPVPGQSVARSSLGMSRCTGTRISERRHSLQEPPSRTRRSSCDLGSRQRRSSLDCQASSELGSRQRRESVDSSDINQHWRQFLQRNRDFASNKEKTLEHKRKAKQEELDKACTFAPKVHEWGLKTEESDMQSCSTETSTSCSEVVHAKTESDFLGACQREMEASVNELKYDSIMERQVPSSSIREDSIEAATCIAESSANHNVAADASGLCYSNGANESAVDERKAEVVEQNQASATLLTSKLPLAAWKEEDRVTVAEGNQGPAKLTCSPSGKLVVSNLASEVTLHDSWPRARLLFPDCDDSSSCEKKLPIVSATASTEVSNCPSEAGGPDNEDDDDLDTLVANLRSHKVYSFHFSG